MSTYISRLSIQEIEDELDEVSQAIWELEEKLVPLRREEDALLAELSKRLNKEV